MELTVYERLVLRNIIPQINGWNFGHMKEAREFVEGMFTPEEEVALQIKMKEDGLNVTWKTQDDNGMPIPQSKDMEISDGLKDKLGNYLKEMDKKGILRFEHYTLCEKFGLE